MYLRRKCGYCRKTNLKTKYQFNNYAIIQCSHCQFDFRDKILSHHEEEALYGKDYYLKLQKEYFSSCLTPNPHDKSRLSDFDLRIDLLENFNEKKNNPKLLDIGCGTGAFSYLAEKRGWQAYGIEISSYAAKIAREKFKVSVYCGEVTDKKFSPKDFDVITFWESIANIEDTPRLLKRISGILRKNGKIALLTTVTDSWLFFIAEFIYLISFGRIKYFVKEGYPIHHANHFTRQNLKKVLKTYGFEIIHWENKEIPYKYTKLPKKFLPILVILGQVAKIFGKTIQVLVIARKS